MGYYGQLLCLLILLHKHSNQLLSQPYLEAHSPSFSPTLFKAQTSEKQNGYAMQWYACSFGSTISGLLVLNSMDFKNI